MEAKEQWPELVGKAGEEAKAIIMKERPDLTQVHVLRDNSPCTMDMNWERVRIFVDQNGLVNSTPVVG